MLQHNQETVKPKFPSKDWFKVPKHRNITIVAAIIIVIVILSISGLLGGQEGNKQFQFGETATLNNIEYTVQDVTEYSVLSTPNMIGQSTYSEAGAKWIAVSITTKNTSSFTKSVSTSDFNLIIGDTQYNVDTNHYTWYIHGNGADSIVGKEKLCYTNSITTISANFSKELIMFFKVPEATNISDTYLSITWAFDEVQMLLNH